MAKNSEFGHASGWTLTTKDLGIDAAAPRGDEPFAVYTMVNRDGVVDMTALSGGNWSWFPLTHLNGVA